MSATAGVLPPAAATVTLRRGDGPVVLGVPHAGTWVPRDIWNGLNARGRLLRDTDWHVDRLYEGLLPDATIVRAGFHRYVIDANRPPADGSLYPGQNTTGLVPRTDFDGAPIWADEPDANAVAARSARYHAPYHAALQAELERVRARHGVAVLYDCHSIRSKIPYLFDGVLPELNIGTADGAACDPRLAAAVHRLCVASGRDLVMNGRFKGGWCTRTYGQPAEGIHAIQMELAQRTYLTTEAPPFALDPHKTRRLRPLLARVLATLSELALALKR